MSITVDRDLVVVGTGPAGLSAGLLAGRYDLQTTLFERSELGGELVNRHSINTYPGFPDGVSGPDLRTDIVTQLREYDLELELAKVTNLHIDEAITLETDDGSVSTRAVILAAGASPKPLECPGASEYVGRGIFDCAMCDGPLYKDEVVAVYGGSERAFSDSHYLTKFAEHVIVIVNESTPSAPPMLVDQAEESDKISVRTDTEVAEVYGDDTLAELRLKNTTTGEEAHESIDGLLVRNELDPNTEFLDGSVSLTETGAIDVDERLATDQPGVFAAGTIRSHSGQRVSAAIGDGATAFRSVQEYLQQSG